LTALVRLKAYEPLAAAVLDQSGQPRSTWWPVAFALQRIGDQRAAPALTRLKFPLVPAPYEGRPWFLPFVGEWFRLHDRIDGRKKPAPESEATLS